MAISTLSEKPYAWVNGKFIVRKKVVAWVNRSTNEKSDIKVKGNENVSKQKTI